MIFSRHIYWIILLHVMLILVTSGTGVWLIISQRGFVIGTLLITCSLFQISRLVNKLNSFNQKLRVFFDAIEDKDNMLYFPEQNVSKEQEKLNRSLNRINFLLAKTQSEYSKQEHFYRSLLEEVPSGVEHLHVILEAIDRKVVVEFDYHSFNRQAVKHHECIPCFLKTWEQRWYLIAEPLNRKNPSVYALERISNLQLTEQQLSPSPHINPQSYFEGCYGVNHEDCNPVPIKIKVYGSQVDYVRARPIHASQEEVEQGDGWSVFSYWLRPSYNFYQMLLWHREKVEVMEPEEVRGEMKKIVNQISKQY